MRPAKGNASSARTRPPWTATNPPPSASRRLTATAMSSSPAPTTQMLWLSWPTEEASAPWRKPKPLTKPRPILPLRPWRSSTQILSRSCSGSACRLPSRKGRLASKSLGQDLSRDDADDRRRRARGRHAKCLCGDRLRGAWCSRPEAGAIRARQRCLQSPGGRGGKQYARRSSPNRPAAGSPPGIRARSAPGRSSQSLGPPTSWRCDKPRPPAHPTKSPGAPGNPDGPLRGCPTDCDRRCRSRERAKLNSLINGASAARSFETEPSRISTCMPLASFSRPSARFVVS